MGADYNRDSTSRTILAWHSRAQFGQTECRPPRARREKHSFSGSDALNRPNPPTRRFAAQPKPLPPASQVAGSGKKGTKGPARLDDVTGAPPSPHIADLIEQIKQSAEPLARDRASRGDLKILSRALRELRYAFKVFSRYRANRKVTVFGSARTPREAPAFLQAVQFGRAMADQGWLVVTGASAGIMEAGHVGAGREKSMGLNILLPFEQDTNPIIAGDAKLVYMKYFFTRKLMFVKECHAVCLLPGGFGTLDEGMEVLTLLQTGKRDMVPVVLLDEPNGDYWRSLEQFIDRQLLGRGMISPEDRSLFRITASVDEAVAEILAFFRVYHSMRYVHDRLVLRLSRPLSPEFVERINVEYAGMLSEGRFALSGPLPEERDEPELAHLPRLVFAFNRSSFGVLRRLIDEVNRSQEVGART